MTKDLIAGIGPTFYPEVGPVGAVGIAQIVFSNGITMDLINLNAGNQPSCAGQTAAQRTAAGDSCTFYTTGTNPAGVQPGIFTLQNDSSGNVTISMSWRLNAYTGLSSTGTSLYAASFSTQLASQTVNDVFATIASGGNITSSYSVSFNGVVPEPATFGLTGGAIMLLGYLRLRKKA